MTPDELTSETTKGGDHRVGAGRHTAVICASMFMRLVSSFISAPAAGGWLIARTSKWRLRSSLRSRAPWS